MERITNIQEKENIINKLYYNNYILELKENDLKHYNELLNEYEIIKTYDNLNLIIHIEKFGIDKDLWFDDEMEIPDKTEDLFIQYNIRKIKRYIATVESNFYIYKAYKENQDCVIASLTGYSDCICNNTFVRYLNDEEKNLMLSIYNDIENKYIERLKKYYKRYNSNIYCRGYWANR